MMQNVETEESTRHKQVKSESFFVVVVVVVVLAISHKSDLVQCVHAHNVGQSDEVHFKSV